MNELAPATYSYWHAVVQGQNALSTKHPRHKTSSVTKPSEQGPMNMKYMFCGKFSKSISIII